MLDNMDCDCKGFHDHANGRFLRNMCLCVHSLLAHFFGQSEQIKHMWILSGVGNR